MYLTFILLLLFFFFFFLLLFFFFFLLLLLLLLLLVASALELRYKMTQTDLTSRSRRVNQSHLTSGYLTPLPAGVTHSVTLKVMGR